MNKWTVLNRIAETGLVAVIRARNTDEAQRMTDACLEGGITALEITFTVPGAHEVIAALQKKNSSNVLIGAGTVLDPETARIAIMNGAEFVVSPSLNADAARMCRRYQIPYMPGAGSVEEVLRAMEEGADIVKVFPGETLGPAFVKAVLAPLPHAPLMPTGGVSLENVATWIQAGCVAVGVGGTLTAGAKTGDFKSITSIARQFVDRIAEVRNPAGKLARA